MNENGPRKVARACLIQSATAADGNAAHAATDNREAAMTALVMHARVQDQPAAGTTGCFVSAWVTCVRCRVWRSPAMPARQLQQLHRQRKGPMQA